MKSTYISFSAACLFTAFPLLVKAQTVPESSNNSLNHAEVGVYADYFRLAPSGSAANYLGVGSRVAFSMNPAVALEAEMNYDFARDYTSTFNNGTTSTIVTSHVRPITGLFGPKFQFGASGPVRVFVTGKIGFLDFSTTTSGNVTGSTFTGAVKGIGGSGTHLAFYPGGGIEGFIGPVGIRAEAGDEVYLNSGTYNNLRVAIGPTIRF